VPLPPSQSLTPAYMKLFEVYCMQSYSPAGTSALSAGHKHCVMHLAALAYLRVSGRRNIYRHHTHHTAVQDEMRIVTMAAATSVSPPPAKGAMQRGCFHASGHYHYRVNTQGNCRRNGHADDRLMYSPYYPPHDGWVAQIKERCVLLIMPSGWTASGGVGVHGSQRCKAKWTY